MLDFFQCKPSSKKINTSLLDITIWILQNNVLGANWSLLQKYKWKHEFEHLQHSKINPLAKLLCWMKFRPDLKADHDLYPGHMQFLNDKGGRSCVLWPQGDSVQYPEWPQLSRWLWGSVCLRPWGMPGWGKVCPSTTHAILLLQALVMFAMISKYFNAPFWQGLPLGSMSVSVDLDFHTKQRPQKSLFNNKAIQDIWWIHSAPRLSRFM